MMMLRRWAVGPSVNNSFPEHISESTCPIVFKFYTQHLYSSQQVQPCTKKMKKTCMKKKFSSQKNFFFLICDRCH